MTQTQMNKISDADFLDAYRERFSLPAGNYMRSKDDVILHLNGVFNNIREREQFIAIYLNGRNQAIKSEVLFTGSLTTSAVYPREVAIKCLENNAAAVVFAHNHPSGNTNPSQDDLTITKKLKEALRTLDIYVHDHLIITGESCYSFSDHGLI